MRERDVDRGEKSDPVSYDGINTGMTHQEEKKTESLTRNEMIAVHKTTRAKKDFVKYVEWLRHDAREDPPIKRHQKRRLKRQFL